MRSSAVPLRQLRQNRGVTSKIYSPRKRLIEKIILPLIPFVGLFLIWQGVAMAGVFREDLLPSPLAVYRAVVELATNGMLLQHITTSIFRVFAGFFLAGICAVPLGISLGWYRKAGSTFSPMIEMLRTISPISWIPLAILWFGIGDIPAIFIIFITAFFPILIATMHAGRHIDPILIRVATNFGAHGGRLFKHVIFPASFPYIIVGLRISLGISWVVVVAAEMVGLRSGLGYLIMDARNFMRTDYVIAGMIVIGIIGFLLDKIMLYAEKRVERHKTRLEDVWGVEDAGDKPLP